MAEEIHYWKVDDRNIFTGTAFFGVGYVKLVHRAVLDERGLVPFYDGKPVFENDFTRDPVHQETGWFFRIAAPG